MRGIKKEDDMNKDPKISAALDLLNAAAKDKRKEIQQLLSTKYTDFRDTITKDTQDVVKSGRKVVDENPWAVVGAAAAGLIAAGLIMWYLKEKK